MAIWNALATRLNKKPVKNKIDTNIQQWIAENLFLGNSPDSIIQSLVENGFNKLSALKEVASAASHPYIQAGMLMNAKISKRDWILENYSLMENETVKPGCIERRHKLSREEFLRDYYSVNRPVIIQGAIDHWPALNKWTPEWLKENFGNATVEIQANRNSDPLYEINMARLNKKVSFGDYIDMISRNGSTNDYYMTARNMAQNMEALQGLWDDFEMLPQYLDDSRGRQGFFWFGPAGTITPLHHDLTNNLLAQVRGRKLFKMIPACQMPYVYNHYHCYSDIDMDNINYERYPLFKKANVIEFILEPGEVLFIPIGCWHYVRGLDISITMSFTNFHFNNALTSHYTTYSKI